MNSAIDTLVSRLREHRLKRDMDFSVAIKYGELRVMCADIWAETILAVASELGLPVVIVGTWDATGE